MREKNYLIVGFNYKKQSIEKATVRNCKDKMQAIKVFKKELQEAEIMSICELTDEECKYLNQNDMPGVKNIGVAYD